MSNSNFVLNQRISYLQFEIDNLTPPSGGYVPINGATTINDLKTFSTLPQSSVVPVSGNDLVNKTYADGLVGVSTLQGVLSNGNTATGSIANINLVDTDVGGQANPILNLQNTNATGSVAMEVYKNKPTAGIAGDVLFNQSVYGKDSLNTKQEYTRISHTLRDASTGGEDGSIEFSAFVNGAVNTFLQINGNENEINCLKTLDMVGNNIRSSTGNLALTTALSTGLGNITATAKGDVAVNSGTNGSVSLTSGGAGGAVNLTGLGVNITSNGSAGEKTTLTSATTIDLVPTTAIRTDSKITPITDITGSSIDFGLGSTIDYRFTLDPTKIELHYTDSANYSAFQTIFQDYSNDEAYFKQTFLDVVAGETTETLIRNDINSHSIKLSESASSANSELTKTDLLFNGVSIRPKYFSSSGSNGVAFSPPVQSIYNLGAITGMATGQKWKIEIGFVGDTYASDGILSYRVIDSVGNDVALNTAFSASVGGSSSATYPKPADVPIPASNTGSFISFNDNFEVGSGTAPFTIDFTGGTYGGTIWNINGWKATITLTYIEG